MIDDHWTCTHWGYGAGNGKEVTWKKLAAERSNTMEILDWSIMMLARDTKKNGRVTLNDQRKSYCVVGSEYQPERKRKHGSTVFMPKYRKTLLRLPIRTDFGGISWKRRRPIRTKSDPMRSSESRTCGTPQWLGTRLPRWVKTKSDTFEDKIIQTEPGQESKPVGVW
jgi:hypothetical protein